MSDHLIHHQQRKHQAQRLILGAFLLVRLGDPLLLIYHFDITNPQPYFRGLVIGGMLSTTVFFIALWGRQLWARYILIALIWVLIVVFSTPLVMGVGSDERAVASSPGLVAVALVLYAAANTLLIRSRRIRRYAATPPSNRR